MLLYNTTEDPLTTGVYACRVQTDLKNIYTDIFLIWTDACWYYLGSDQRYRGDVAGWIGPLQRKMN